MTALSLYTETFRMVLNLRSGEDTSWTAVYENFCNLRESLLCGVCANLTVVPYQRFTDHCSHNVCRECLGGKLQIPCIWCSENKNFEDNVQIRIVLQCYKNMCKFILSCGFFRNTLLSDLSLPKLNFLTMVSDGSKLNDDYRYTSTHRLFGKRLRLLSLFNHGNRSLNGRKAVYRLRLKEYTKAISDKAALKNYLHENYIDSDKRSNFTGGITSYLLQKCLLAPKRRNCHCGIATIHPRKLTCCGQRCPCYVAGRACFNCRCRGCKNPQKFRVASNRVHKFRALSKTAAGLNGLINGTTSSDQVQTNGVDKQYANSS